MSQSIDKWKEGRYYDLQGNSHEGLIYYDYHSFKIKFRKTTESRNTKLKAWNTKGFVIEKDSFSILENFYYEGPGGGKHKEIMDFVQVLDTSPVKLYKHYANAKRGITALGIGISYNEELVNYLLLKPDETKPLLVKKRNFLKFKVQMIEYFKEYPEFGSKIESNEFGWNSLPELIRELNQNLTKVDN